MLRTALGRFLARKGQRADLSSWRGQRPFRANRMPLRPERNQSCSADEHEPRSSPLQCVGQRRTALHPGGVGAVRARRRGRLLQGGAGDSLDVDRRSGHSRAYNGPLSHPEARRRRIGDEALGPRIWYPPPQGEP